VFTFLLGRFMPKLDARMQVVQKPLVSFAFQIPGRQPTTEKSGVFLYRYGQKAERRAPSSPPPSS